jgi:hypothetical protein
VSIPGLSPAFPLTYSAASGALDGAKDLTAKVFTSFGEIWAAFRKRKTKFREVFHYVCDKVADAFRTGEAVPRKYGYTKSQDEFARDVANIVRLVFSAKSKIVGDDAVKILEQIVGDRELKGIFLTATEIMGECLADSGLFTKVFDGAFAGRAASEKVTAFEFILSRDENDGSFDLKVAMLKLAEKIHAVRPKFFDGDAMDERLKALRDSSTANQSGGTYYESQIGGKAAIFVFDRICKRGWGEGGKVDEIFCEPEVFLVAAQIAEEAAVAIGDNEDIKAVLSSSFSGDSEASVGLSILQYAALVHGFKDPRTIALVDLYDRVSGERVGERLKSDDASLFGGRASLFHGCRYPIGLPLNVSSFGSGKTYFSLDGALAIKWPSLNVTKRNDGDPTGIINQTLEYGGRITLPALAQLTNLQSLTVGQDVDMEALSRYAQCAAGLGLDVTIVLDAPRFGHDSLDNDNIKAYGDLRERMSALPSKGGKPSLILPKASVAENRRDVRYQIFYELTVNMKDTPLKKIFEGKADGHVEMVSFGGREYAIKRGYNAANDGDYKNYTVTYIFPEEIIGNGTVANQRRVAAAAAAANP